MSKKNIGYYTEKNAKEAFDKAIKNPDTLYNANFINWTRNAYQTENSLKEIIAEWIFNSRNLNIKTIERENYDVNHDGKFTSEVKSEKNLAKALFKETLEGIGFIFDYQVPLKAKRTDKVGEIDLVSLDKNTIRLIELKKESSQESLLRCALEIYTYSKQLHEKNFKKSFSKNNKCVGSEKIKLTILLPKKSKAAKEYGQINNFPKLKKLIDKFEIDVVTFNPEKYLERIKITQ